MTDFFLVHFAQDEKDFCNLGMTHLGANLHTVDRVEHFHTPQGILQLVIALMDYVDTIKEERVCSTNLD